MNKIAENYPVGPCNLPLECDCGTLVTEDNVVHEACKGECEMCEYCDDSKCPQCKNHVHCGGCI